MFYIFCFFLVVTGSQGLDKEELVKSHEECLELVLQEARSEGAVDPKVRTYYMCILNKLGVLNDDGDVHEELSKTTLQLLGLEDDEIEEILGKCDIAGKKGISEETAWELVSCVIKMKPNLF